VQGDDVKIIYRDQEWELHGRRQVREAIREVGLSPQAVLAVRGGELLTEDITVEEDDEVRLVAVISGG
jgi:sulfur carrier protein